MSVFDTKNKQTWCPGCGNYHTEKAVKGALEELKLSPEKCVFVFDIGCAGNANNWYRGNTFHSLHGRVIPVAQGIKLANHQLTVLGFGGDGGTYGEGGNHLIHAARRNVDFTLIVHNNQIYGLTTGQASPTSDLGFKTKTTPQGVIEPPLQPLALALAVSSGVSFVARGFAGDEKHLQKIIVQAIKHKGFALVDVLQPCVAFNYQNTYQWFRERVYKLEEIGHNPLDKMTALKKAFEWGEKIPIGIFYQKEKPTFESHFPALSKQPLVSYQISKINISSLLKKFS